MIATVRSRCRDDVEDQETYGAGRVLSRRIGDRIFLHMWLNAPA